MIDHNKIVQILRKVKDPRSGMDIVAAKMVEDLVVEGNNVNFSIVLNNNDQGIKSELNFACISHIGDVYPNANVNIHLKMKSDQSQESSSILPQVKNIIAIASGKGGVGKSTVATNLAIALKHLGARVGLLDADVYGPSIPTMMGLVGQKPAIEMLYGKHKIVPLQAHGIYVMSIGFIVEPEQAVVLRGPRLGGVIRQFLGDCLWPELDYLLIDLPPGTGDVQLTLVQTVPVTGTVIVTTPQEIAIIDAIKAMNMFLLPHVNVPIIGVVENMSWFTPEELPNNKYYIFGEGGGTRVAQMGNTVLLGQIPLIQGVRESSDNGSPIALDSRYAQYNTIAQNLVRQVNLRNESMEPTRIVKMEG